MPKNEFVLQGFTARTHTSAIRDLFSVPDIERVWLGVAFVNEGGVELIEEKLKANAKVATVFAGIRNDITSYQGLKCLLDTGCKLYTVDTGSRRVIFHPKHYLVRGKLSARLAVGSANLTRGGLNNNIEAGMLLSFDLTDAADKALVEEIEAQFLAISKDYPDNVTRVSKVAPLDAMLACGNLVDETVVIPPRKASASGGAGSGDSVPLIKLKVSSLHHPIHKPKAKHPKAVSAKKGKADEGDAQNTEGIKDGEFELVWESKPLARRDLNVPTAANTNRTGSIDLDKGLLPPGVDHRHYFKDEVFSDLAWKATNATGDVVEAFAKFQLVVKGINVGEYDLRIGHTTSTTSKTYTQRNAMTRLSWGAVRKYIAHDDLLDRTLALYRDRTNPARFVLEIC